MSISFGLLANAGADVISVVQHLKEQDDPKFRFREESYGKVRDSLEEYATIDDLDLPRDAKPLKSKLHSLELGIPGESLSGYAFARSALDQASKGIALRPADTERLLVFLGTYKKYLSELHKGNR